MRQGVDRRPTIRPPPWGPISKARATTGHRPRSVQRCASKLCAVDGRGALHHHQAEDCMGWIATALPGGAVLARLEA